MLPSVGALTWFAACVQSLNPKGNVVRTDITSVEASPALYDRDNVFTVCIKSNDKWQMSAANEVSAFLRVWAVQRNLPKPLYSRHVFQPLLVL